LPADRMVRGAQWAEKPGFNVVFISRIDGAWQIVM
jgi:hypothetical protein